VRHCFRCDILAVFIEHWLADRLEAIA